MTALELDSQAVAYDMKGAGVPLVLIHEVTMDQRLWYTLRPFLTSRYRIISLDLLGHGKSICPLEDMSIERATLHLQQLLERTDTGATFLVGVSMGATIAMRLALKMPSLVRGLVLVSPWTSVDGHMQRLIERLFRLAEGGEVSLYTELFLRYVLPIRYLEHHPALVNRLRAIAREQNARAVAYTWAACLAAGVTTRLEEIRAPSLVIAGMHDLFTPPYLARMVAEGLVDVVMEIWQECGHFPFLEYPRRFSRRLEGFVRHCLASASQE